MALLATFVVFRVGFVARLPGGILVGLAGDRLGRKAALLLTIMLMVLGTVSIGRLPGFDSIGIVVLALLARRRVAPGLNAAAFVPPPAMWMFREAVGRPLD